ncbi:MAG: PAS domain S-box protein, partial [Akkermansiaceae bacterium]|nr:PAS domain S-box protein [Verrucomicrobiales bacterium]
MNLRIRTTLSQVALRTALLYALAGAVWILLSDKVLRACVSNEIWLRKLEIYKGWAFIAVTAGLLYVVLRGQLNRWEREAAARRQAEEALRLSEERFQLAMRGANDGLWDWNLETNAIYYSPRWKSMLGYADKELENTPEIWKRLLHLDDYEPTMAHLQRLIGGQSDTFEAEFRMRHKEGHWVHLLSRAFPTERRHGKLVRLVGTHLDLTARKLGEEALREREAKYRAVIETSADGFWMIDREGKILEVNDAYLRRSGYSREELLTMQVSDVEGLISPEAIQERIDRIVKNGTDLFETLHRAKDGTLWQAEIDASYWPISGGRLFVFVRDINLRKRSEALLRARMEFSRMAVTKSLDELLRTALDTAELFTSSRMGLFHFVTPDQKNVWLQAWSTNTAKAWPSLVKSAEQPLNEAGLWADCFHSRTPAIHNDTSVAASPRLLNGNAKNVRYLLVPLLRNDEVIAMVSVGNKSTDYTGEDACMVGEIAAAIIDLVERKRVEEALHESEQRLELAVAAAGIGTWEVTLPSLQVKWSDAYGKLFGCSVSQYPRTEEEFFRLVHPEDHQRIRHALAQALREDVPYECEYRVLWPDGTVHWHAVLGRAVRDSERRPIRFTGVGMDITERKRAEAAIQRSEERHRALVETTFDWIWELDAEARYTFASPRVTDLLGYSPEEILGRSPFDFMSAEEAKRVRAIFNAA